jgi:hypothetical protein
MNSKHKHSRTIDTHGLKLRSDFYDHFQPKLAGLFYKLPTDF